LLLQILSDDPRPLLAHRYGHFSMMNDFFLIQKHLFLNDGLSLNGGKKLVSRKLLSRFSMAEGLVLEDRKRLVPVKRSDGRLALMEMRVVLARMLWEYEFELAENQRAPILNHVNLSAGELEMRIKKVDRG